MSNTPTQTLVGKGRDAISMFLDADSFLENMIGPINQDPHLAPTAVVGTAKLNGRTLTVISTDAKARNPRFPVVMAGVIGLEEAYKMATAVYNTIEADRNNATKRPILLLVDTPGNAPGKVEETFGMNCATGAYQLALAEARQHGHPVIAMIIGRAISGAFLCHGLQADRILTLPKSFGTMIHVMPLSSIARITKMDLEKLEELSLSNPVFASGAEFFHKLGGVEEVVTEVDNIPATIDKHITEIYDLNNQGLSDQLGPWGRGQLGNERGGRTTRKVVLDTIQEQYSKLEEELLS